MEEKYGYVVGAHENSFIDLRHKRSPTSYKREEHDQERRVNK